MNYNSKVEKFLIYKGLLNEFEDEYEERGSIYEENPETYEKYIEMYGNDISAIDYAFPFTNTNINWNTLAIEYRRLFRNNKSK
jgi:hypothetical protein